MLETNFTGKPYAGKPHVRIDEGEKCKNVLHLLSTLLANDTVLCPGAELVLDAYSPNATYCWQDSSANPTFSVTEPGRYFVTLSNLCGTNSDTVDVAYYDTLAVDIGNDTILCELVNVLLDAGHPQATSYQWQDNSTNSTYTVWHDGEYWVAIRDGCHQRANDTVNITYLTELSVTLGNDTTLCDEKISIPLDVSAPHATYLWQDGSTSPHYHIRLPGLYSVTVTNLCRSVSDEIEINVMDCDLTYWLPTAFSPNNDGINDHFAPVFTNPDQVGDFQMDIYNRWGELVFRTQNLQIPWEGKDNAGNPCMAGSYVYLIRFTNLDGKSFIKRGAVGLVR